jgi:hypothetical protein
LTSTVVPREPEGTLLLIGLVGLQTSIPLSGTAQLLIPLLRAAAAHGSSPGVSPSRPRAVARRPVPGTIAAELRRGERDDR